MLVMCYPGWWWERYLMERFTPTVPPRVICAMVSWESLSSIGLAAIINTETYLNSCCLLNKQIFIVCPSGSVMTQTLTLQSYWYFFHISFYLIFLEGPSLVLGGNTTGMSTAVYVSPVLAKSKDSYGKCLKFKYKIVGPGARSLTIYQEMPYGYGRQPIWTDDVRRPGYMWQYGQTSISTISSFRVSNK